MTTALKILIADDDADLRAALTEQLALHEIHPPSKRTPAKRSFLRWSRDRPPILSSWTFVCRIWTAKGIVEQLRRKAPGPDHHVDRARFQETDTVEGFDAGANDYVAKPFEFAHCWRESEPICVSISRTKRRFLRIGPYTSGLAPNI